MGSYRNYREMMWERISKIANTIIEQKELEQDWIWLERNLGTQEDLKRLMYKLFDLLDSDYNRCPDVVWKNYIDNKVKEIWAKGPLSKLALPILREELKN